MSPKRMALQRSRDDRVVAGVVGGIANHFGLNPTWARIGYVLLSVFSAGFPGILVYLILWVAMSKED
jgi:phage shock protein C